MKQVTFYFNQKFQTDLELNSFLFAGGKPYTVQDVRATATARRGPSWAARPLAMPPQTDQMQYSPSSQRQHTSVVVVIPIKLGTSY